MEGGWTSLGVLLYVAFAILTPVFKKIFTEGTQGSPHSPGQAGQELYVEEEAVAPQLIVQPQPQVTAPPVTKKATRVRRTANQPQESLRVRTFFQGTNRQTALVLSEILAPPLALRRGLRGARK